MDSGDNALHEHEKLSDERIIVNEDIRIIDKPEWVTWDTIHEVIWQAHAENRRNGIRMRYPTLSGDGIKKKLDRHGRMIVAITNDGSVVGTAAIIPKNVSTWFGEHAFAYCCFAAVLPEYNGKGVYKKMCLCRESIAKEMGLTKMLFDTHAKNRHVIDYSVRNGYRQVDEKHYIDHYNVVMVKWLNGCPYSRFRCTVHFFVRRIIIHTRTFIKCVLRSL